MGKRRNRLFFFQFFGIQCGIAGLFLFLRNLMARGEVMYSSTVMSNRVAQCFYMMRIVFGAFEER